MTMVIVVNVLVAYSDFISIKWAIAYMAIIFLGCWFIVFLTSASWVAYMVHNDFEEWLEELPAQEIDPPTPTEKTHVFIERERGYDLIGEVISGGRGEKYPHSKKV